MSWQAYVDSNLVGTGKVSKAAIIGHNGGTWATSSGFVVSPQEGLDLAAAFKDASNLRSKGAFINKEKHMVVLANDRSIYGKKEKGGFAAVKTTQAILIGTYVEPLTAGNCNNTVEKLADYLIEQGY
eukprot:TRINITY_DN607_c0_g1_i15.p1 TRINITY_DN607_c0_g1~~TRINITY_DN607_c0_g1_i15.p1  ORF type:complete len:127 (+),score=30.15 TRINITY_DN607_c0_g1_i15:114-494(+)